MIFLSSTKRCFEKYWGSARGTRVYRQQYNWPGSKYVGSVTENVERRWIWAAWAQRWEEGKLIIIVLFLIVYYFSAWIDKALLYLEIVLSFHLSQSHVHSTGVLLLRSESLSESLSSDFVSVEETSSTASFTSALISLFSAFVVDVVVVNFFDFEVSVLPFTLKKELIYLRIQP